MCFALFTADVFVLYRDEIIEHYSRLTLDAARREQRALWRIRRWQLQPQRLQLLGAAEDLSLWRPEARGGEQQLSHFSSLHPFASAQSPSAVTSGTSSASNAYRPPLPLWLRRALGTYAPYLSDDLPDASAPLDDAGADAEEERLLERLRLQRGQSPNRSLEAQSSRLAIAAFPSSAPAMSSSVPLASSDVHISNTAASVREFSSPSPLITGAARSPSEEVRLKSASPSPAQLKAPSTSTSSADSTQQSTRPPTTAAALSPEKAPENPVVRAPANPNAADSQETKADEENVYVQEYFERLSLSGNFSLISSNYIKLCTRCSTECIMFSDK